MIDTEGKFQISADILANWQDILDLVVDIIRIPVALIMRFQYPHIEVFVSSNSEGNPYHPGNKEILFGSGLYCETVLKTQDKLLVPDALADAN